MKINLRFLIIMTLVIILLTGCGTVKKNTEDENSNDSVVIPEITQALDSSKLVLVNNPEPDIDYISCLEAEVTEPHALVEVYRNYPYTALNFVNSAISNDLGRFDVEIDNSDDFFHQSFYVMATAPGKRTSTAIIMSK